MLKDASIVIRKSQRTLELRNGGELVATFPIVLGSAAAGNKETEGDGKTPEGCFYIFTKNLESKFHLSLGISYPDKNAAERGLAEKLITRDEYLAIVAAIDENKMPLQKTRLGGEIYIHGGGLECDWTKGCVALDDSKIEELFKAVPIGCPVTILP